MLRSVFEKSVWALPVLVVFASLAFSATTEAACGYKSCPSYKANMVNVHLVPHSHDDVGWLKTVDQYYYGKNNSIQHAGVQYIFDNIVQELLKDSKRRFIQVESAFFYKWYIEQSADTKKNVKKLVDDGRLEFTGGAWSMNDEAAVHYQSVIDQFSMGLQFLSKTFGSCARPRIGWQIDPFGHSREMASIFAQMGYDGEFFARTDWVEKGVRLRNMTAEMIWKASAELGERSEIFTGLLYNHYSAPPGFCFDSLCTDDPIIDGDSYENNVQQKVDRFLEYTKNMSELYRGTHLMMPMGDDFHYENAAMNFKNMDKLIKYVNERQVRGSKVNVFYSTPACYLNALHESKLTWPNKTQDFFPYSTDWHTYWTGYFSSRPTQKRFERDGNHLLQVAKQLSSFAKLTSSPYSDNLDELRHVMGIMQHHDAITGTEKQHVAADYDRLLAAAMRKAEFNTQTALRMYTNLTRGDFATCPLLNISVCDYTTQSVNKLVVTLFNPLSTPVSEYVRIPVAVNATYQVLDRFGKPIMSQVLRVPNEVAALPFRDSAANYELVFHAYVIKLENFYISAKPLPRSIMDEDDHIKISSADDIDFVSFPAGLHQRPLPLRFLNHKEAQQAAPALTSISNKYMTLTFDTNGMLSHIERGGIIPVLQEFYYYKGALGNNEEFKNRSSGAYIFRPNGTEVLVANKATITVYRGNLVTEVHQRFNDWVSQVIRLYAEEDFVEFEWLVGPLPIDDGIGKEVITRITTNLNTKGIFWTDSNGREMMRRVRNEREYFNANLTESVSGNYYPVTTRIAMEDDYTRIALLTDRAQGGSSVRNGELELMLHRRLLHDDAFGVGEALNETAYGRGLVARGKYYLTLHPKQHQITSLERTLQQKILLPLYKFFSNTTQEKNYLPKQFPNFNAVPPKVHLLTLEPYSKNEHLIRFEHFMDKNETNAATFNIRSIFDELGGEEIRETTLDGSMSLSDMKRFKFQPDDAKHPSKVEYYTSKHTPLVAKKKDATSKFSITLDPMQIRTFIIKWK